MCELRVEGAGQIFCNKKLKADLQREGDSDEFIDSFLRSFVTEYTSRILTE